MVQEGTRIPSRTCDFVREVRKGYPNDLGDLNRSLECHPMLAAILAGVRWEFLAQSYWYVIVMILPSLSRVIRHYWEAKIDLRMMQVI